MSRGTGFVEVVDSASGSTRRWFVQFDVATEKTTELTPGQIVRLRVMKSTTGLTPPGDANALQAVVKNGPGTAIRTFPLDPSLNEQTFEIAWTGSAFSTGTPAAGAYEVDLRATRTELGSYDVSSDNRGTQSLSAGQAANRDRLWQRATTTAVLRVGRGVGAVAAALLGYGSEARVRAEFGHQLIDPLNASYFSWRRADTNAELRFATGSHGSLKSAVEAILTPSVNNALPKARLATGLIVQWANFPASGSQFLLPTVTEEPYPEVDPRIWFEHKLQVSPNKGYGTPPSTTFNALSRLTTEIGYLASSPRNAEGKRLNGILWTSKIWDLNEEAGSEAFPVITRQVTSTTVNGEDGWPATLLAWRDQLPAGAWINKVRIDGPGGATGLEMDPTSQHSLIAIDPRVVCVAVPGPEGVGNLATHFAPGVPFLTGMVLFHFGRREVLIPDLGTPKMLIGRMNQELGRPETLQLDGVTWLSSLDNANNVYHPLQETYPGSRTFVKVFTAAQTAGWSMAEIIVIGEAYVNGSPVSNYLKEPVVGPFARHDTEAGVKPEDITAIANAVWEEPVAEVRTAGSYGHRVVTNLDAPVSTRSTPADVPPADPRMVNLDAPVSSRLPSTDARLGNLDATVSSRATPANIPTDYVKTTDARLANLDAAVSTRATPADVTVQVYSEPVPEGRVS